MTPKEFLEKYFSLCRESGFCLVSDDPYVPVILSRIDPNSSNADEVMNDSWVSCTLSSFDYE